MYCVCICNNGVCEIYFVFALVKLPMSEKNTISSLLVRFLLSAVEMKRGKTTNLSRE